MQTPILLLLFVIFLPRFAHGASTPAEPPPPGELIVFVGQKIDVQEIDEPCGSADEENQWAGPAGDEPVVEELTICMDQLFTAKYRVLEMVYGYHEFDVIEFSAADHYGYPAFAKHEHVLLYVIRVEGEYYHSKYRFDAVYPTKGSGWAGCGDHYDHEDYEDMDPTLKKIYPIDFDPPVTFELESQDPEEIARDWPAPVFEVVNGRAVCRLGTTAADLFEIQKNGVLKYRGWFPEPAT